METAIPTRLQVLACSCSSSFHEKKTRKTSFGATHFPTTQRGRAPGYLRTMTQVQQRPTCLPGLDPPYLDGTLAGDFGFDPLGLEEDPQSLKWYVQAELIHARFAMAGVAGILLTDFIVAARVTGISSLPVWYEAGATKFGFASTRTLFIIQLLLMGFVETKRYMDFSTPRSQAKEGTFFGLEASLEGLEAGCVTISELAFMSCVIDTPGGPLFNPLGIAKNVKNENAHEWKQKEIKNGRLAMVAMLGFIVQASVTHSGPIDNLLEHLSNPWHKTVIQTLAGPGS